MSAHRLMQAWNVKDVSPAVKLLLIYVGDNWTEQDQFAEVSTENIAEFCCISEVSVSGIVADAEWKGYFSRIVEISEGKWRIHFTDWEVRVSRPSRPKLSKELKSQIRERDVSCVYCGETNEPFHIDHIVPQSRGGSDEPNNLALACATCNVSKRDRLISEWSGPNDRVVSFDRVLKILEGAS